MSIIETILAVVAIYCGAMWLYLAPHSIKTGLNVENETFHLGICFVLSIGFLGLLLK